VVPPGAARTLVQYAERSLLLLNPEGVPSDLPLRAPLVAGADSPLLYARRERRGRQSSERTTAGALSYLAQVQPSTLGSVCRAARFAGPNTWTFWIVIVCIEFDWKGMCVTKIPSFCLISFPYYIV
jgi:hypothetical protein